MYKSKESEFEDAMYLIYERADRECHYRATYFKQMIRERGAVQTAKLLVNSIDEKIGFKTLLSLKRLDLTVEALIVEKVWEELFEKEDLLNANRRLLKHGYVKK